MRTIIRTWLLVAAAGSLVGCSFPQETRMEPVYPAAAKRDCAKGGTQAAGDTHEKC
jgi:hypothetical protein